MSNSAAFRSNDVVSGFIHLAGALCAVAVLVVLVVFGALRGTAWHVVAFSLYGAGLVVLYLASTLFHLFPHSKPRAKEWLRRVDHAAIFVLIAATYTPVTLLSLHGGWRWALFGTVWGMAAIGVTLKLARLSVPAVVNVLIYLAMGWMIVLATAPLLAGMGTAAFVLLASGGASYTIGVVFYLFDYVLPPRRHVWMHEIFHLFVLGGSALHTVVMFDLLR